MISRIMSIDITKQIYHTSTVRNDINAIDVPFEFRLIHDSKIWRLATKAERILLCK